MSFQIIYMFRYIRIYFYKVVEKQNYFYKVVAFRHSLTTFGYLKLKGKFWTLLQKKLACFYSIACCFVLNYIIFLQIVIRAVASILPYRFIIGIFHSQKIWMMLDLPKPSFINTHSQCTFIWNCGLDPIAIITFEFVS